MLSKKQLEHLAELSRLELTESDKTKFLKQLKEILEFVSILKKVDTTAVEPLHQVTKRENVWREDTVVDFTDCDALLGSAPEHENGYIKTKPIFTNNKE